jgi:surface polysaccharide O-acyltransferase-like enzyme
MLTGFLLLGKTEPLGQFLQKRLVKVAIPLLAWSVIYLVWSTYLGGDGMKLRNFSRIFYQPAYYHFWYFYALIGLYLFIPILRVLASNAEKKVLFYFVGIWFVAASFFPMIENITDLNFEWDFRFIGGFVGYLVLGTLIGQWKFGKKGILIAWIVLLLSLSFTIIATGRASGSAGEFDGQFYEYLSPNIILAAGSSFLLIRMLFSKIQWNDRWEKVLSELGMASLGIYVIHPIVLFYLQKGLLGRSLSADISPALLSIPATVLAAYLISLALVLAMRKIPVIRGIVP